MFRVLAALTLVPLACQGLIAQQRPERVEADDVKSAERSLVASFVVLDSSDGKSLCPACREVVEDEISLAMRLIAVRNSAASLRSLSGLHRFVLDASFGEDFDQDLCRKGALMEKYLLELRADVLRNQCLKEVRDSAKAFQVNVVRAESICASEAAIREHIKQSLDMARHPPISCEP